MKLADTKPTHPFAIKIIEAGRGGHAAFYYIGPASPCRSIFDIAESLYQLQMKRQEPALWPSLEVAKEKIPQIQEMLKSMVEYKKQFPNSKLAYEHIEHFVRVVPWTHSKS